MIDKYDIKDAYESLESIKKHTNENIDGEVLYAALSLFTWAGMKKKEIVSAQIQDIDYNGDNIVGINTNGNDNEDLIRLFGHPKQVLTEYLQYLNSFEDSDTNSDSPLFPVYEGESGKQNLSRHLVYLGETYGRWGHQYEWELGLLKEIGRFDYYLNKKESTGSEDIALQETVTQFRLKERQTKDVIEKCSQNTPSKFEKILHHEGQMGRLDFSNEVEIEEYKKEGFRLINKLTKDSEKRSRRRKNFEADLSEAREEFLRKQSEKLKPPERLNYHEKLSKNLEEFNPTIDYNSPNFDWAKRFPKEHGNDKDDHEKSDEDDQDISDKN